MTLTHASIIGHNVDDMRRGSCSCTPDTAREYADRSHHHQLQHHPPPRGARWTGPSAARAPAGATRPRARAPRARCMQYLLHGVYIFILHDGARAREQPFRARDSPARAHVHRASVPGTPWHTHS